VTDRVIIGTPKKGERMTSDAAAPGRLVHVHIAAQHWGVSTHTIRRWIKAGKVQAVKSESGYSWRVRIEGPRVSRADELPAWATW